MIRCLVLTLSLLWAVVTSAAEVTDSTGRAVRVPDRIAHVLPAGPPAAILLEAIAPDLMMGWPGPMSGDARDMVAPDAAKLLRIPRLTGRDDVTEQIRALKPDLILDYGGVTPRYFDLAEKTRQRTGIPVLLYTGAIDQIPRVARALGAVLHRETRAEAVAVFAEALLALPATADRHPKVLYARGTDGLNVAAPDTEVTELFKLLDWQVVAPDGPKGEKTTFRPSTIGAIRALDPDILIFSDPAMRERVVNEQAWRTVRAVREGNVHVAPALPFGWVEEPPSINRLLGLAWLRGHEPAALAAAFNAAVYGRALTSAQIDAVLAGVRPIKP